MKHKGLLRKYYYKLRNTFTIVIVPNKNTGKAVNFRLSLSQIITGLFFLGMLFISLSSLYIRYIYDDYDKKEIRNVDINQITEMKENLENLIRYLDSQKNEIILQQETINKLNNERKELEPVLEANKETINKIFQLQEIRTKNNIWRDLIIAFIVGNINSLSAWYIMKILATRKMSSI